MSTVFGISTPALFGQLLIGLINGSFYAILSLGLAVIFGMLRVINFAHGAQYMLGAFVAWFLPQYTGIGFWPALIAAPLVVAAVSIVIERTMLARPYQLDHLYAPPAQLTGAVNLGFMVLPIYRGFVVVASLVLCIATWLLIEKTKFGAYLRAATENPVLVQSFGVNVPRLLTLTYALGAGLAAVVVGGMGSILGAIVTGYGLGVLEGLTKVFYPQASSTVIFIVMAIVLLIRPAGLFGRE